MTLKYQSEGKPYLVGKCFRDTKHGAGLAIVESQVLKNKEGQDVQAYLTALILGTITFNGPALEVRSANKELKSLVEKGELEEVSCESGSPIGK